MVNVYFGLQAEPFLAKLERDYKETMKGTCYDPEFLETGNIGLLTDAACVGGFCEGWSLEERVAWYHRKRAE